MAPRKARKTYYALIWWTTTCMKDVVQLNVFPKGKRSVNDIAEVRWMDYKTGKNTFHEAKILAIDDDKFKLDKLVVTDRGEIKDPSNKIFSTFVMQEKKHCNQNKSLQKSIKKSNKRQIEETINNNDPIFPVANKFQKRNKLEKENHRELVYDLNSGLQETHTGIPNNANLLNAFPTTFSNSNFNYQNDSMNFPQVQESNNDREERNEYLRYNQLVERNNGYESLHGHSTMNEENIFSRNNSSQAVLRSNVTENVAVNVTSLPNETESNHLHHRQEESYETRTMGKRHDFIRDNNYQTLRTPNATEKPPFTNQTKPKNLNLQHQQKSYENSKEGTENKSQPGTSTMDDSYNFSRNNGYHFLPRSTVTEQSLLHLNGHQQQFSENLNIGKENDCFLRFGNSTSFNDGMNEKEYEDLVSSSDESSDDLFTTFDEESREKAVKKMASLFPFKITRSHVETADLFLGAMKFAYEFRTKSNYKPTNFKIPIAYFQPGIDMEEISPHCGFFLRKEILNYIRISAKNGEQYDWKIIVKTTLIEVYGEALKSYSASGKRSNRPGIDYRLLKGLDDWANRVSQKAVSKQELITYINKSISNKIGYKPRSTKKFTTQKSQFSVSTQRFSKENEKLISVDSSQKSTDSVSIQSYEMENQQSNVTDTSPKTFTHL